jgi:hypothetical protein
MFRKILEKAQLTNYRAVAKKDGLLCPSCATRAHLIPASTDEIISCAACGTKASIHEWIPRAGEDIPGNADLPPPGTKITRESPSPGTTVWKIPASGRSGGLLIFAVLWGAIVGVVSGGFLASFLSDGGNSEKAPLWFLIPFFGIFWAVGLGMFYAGFRNKYARHQLVVSDSLVTLRRELFGRTKETSLPASGITSVSQVEFYQQNYQPVHGIEIRGSGGKLRFGSILDGPEKAWLVADLRRTILGPTQPISASEAAPHSVRQSSFSFVIPTSRKGFMLPAILFSAIGITFVTVGIFFMHSRPPQAEIDPTAASAMAHGFRGVSVAFQIMWTAISSLFALGGLTRLVWLWRTRGQELRLEGNDSEVAVRTFAHGLVIKERSYPRTSVTGFRTSVNGSSSGRTKKRIEMFIGNKSETLAHWVDEEKADAFATEARGALG